MKLDILLKVLLKLQLQGQGHLEVRLDCDHGQTPMTMTGSGIDYVTEDSYMPDILHSDEVEDFPDAHKVIILEAY